MKNQTAKNTTKTLDVKRITVSAILAALSVMIPLWMPFKLPLPAPFSATIASHVPAILAMFISPFTVVCTSIGSAIGFFFVLGPIVALRAFSHIFFGLAGFYMIKKRMNIFLVILVTMLVHSASEMLVVLLYGKVWAEAWLPVGVVAFVHHLIDFTLSLIVLKGLNTAKILDVKVKYGIK